LGTFKKNSPRLWGGGIFLNFPGSLIVGRFSKGPFFWKPGFPPRGPENFGFSRGKLVVFPQIPYRGPPKNFGLKHAQKREFTGEPTNQGNWVAISTYISWAPFLKIPGIFPGEINLPFPCKKGGPYFLILDIINRVFRR